MARLHSVRRTSLVLPSRRLLVAEPKVRDPGLAAGGGGTPPTDPWATVEALKFVVRGPSGQPPPPGGLTSITPGTDTIQAACDTYGPNTKFGLNGTYTLAAAVVPYDGQEFYNTGSTLIQGTGSPPTSYAFRAQSGRGNNCRWEGLEIADFYHVGVWLPDVFGGVVNWCYLHDVGIGRPTDSFPPSLFHGGLTGTAGGHTVSNSILHRGGELAAVMQAQNETLYNNEISYANVNDIPWTGATSNAAGVKLHSSPGSSASYNWCHHNNGPALWWDDGPQDTVGAHHNLIEDHWLRAAPGIMYEISGGDPPGTFNEFHTNVIRGLHFSAYYVSESADAWVHTSKVEDCYGALVAQEGVPGRTDILTNVLFENNRVRQPNIGVGEWFGWFPLAGGIINAQDPAAVNLIWQNNTYAVEAAIPQPFAWQGSKLTVAQWRALHPTEQVTTY